LREIFSSAVPKRNEREAWRQAALHLELSGGPAASDI
jgi:hypothetical protein